MTRDDTMKRFKKGTMAYKSTPLGGCTNVGQCDDDKKGLNILDCRCLIESCKHMVLKPSKVISLIPYQQHLVNTLDTSSVTYAMEKRDLDALIQVRDSWQITSTKESYHV